MINNNTFQSSMIIFIFFVFYIVYLYSNILNNHLHLKSSKKTFYLLLIGASFSSYFLLLDPLQFISNYLLLKLGSGLILFTIPTLVTSSDNIFKRIFLPLFFYSINYLSIQIFTFLFSIYQGNYNILVTTYFLPALVMLIIYILDQLTFKKTKSFSFYLPLTLIHFLLLISGVSLSFILVSEKEIFLVYLFTFFLILTNLCSHYLYLKKLTRNTLDRDTTCQLYQLKEEELFSLIQKLSSIKSIDKEKQEQLKEVKSIHLILEKNNVLKEPLKDFFVQLEKAIEDKLLLSYSENKTLNANLFLYEEIFFKEEIDFKYHCDVPKQLNINEFEFCLLINTILNKAIESCKMVKNNRIIQLTVVCRKDIYIKCSCSAPKDFIIENGQLISLEDEFDIQKLNTLLVEEIVNKYQGSISINKKDTYLDMEIRLEN